METTAQPRMIEAKRMTLGDGAWLEYAPDFYDRASADALFERLMRDIDWEAHTSARLGGRTFPRRIAWVGDHAYTYSGITHPPAPWSPTLLDIRRSAEQFVFDESTGQFQGVLLNLYRDGMDSVGFHADDEPEIQRDTPIASISLGQPRQFIVRHRSARNAPQRKQDVTLTLAHGSMVVMGGTLQRHWIHAVPKQPGIRDARINLTFRQYAWTR
ncbi:MAG: alpha-ketoglutarate-dependent dioxygenase AlkB [bacterium]|nr:alpha-ketoglutarate-dependent dioxygenase AlkB [bacterium]